MEIVGQTVYMINTVMHFQPRHIRFIILTDMKENVEKIIFIHCAKYIDQIEIYGISTNETQEWISDNGYIYRVKIKAVQWFYQRYKENVVFMDSDIFAVKDITPLFDKIEKGKFLMYSKGTIPLSKAIFQSEPNSLESLQDYIKGEHFCVYDGAQEYLVPCKYNHGNSGVIGMSYKDEALLEKVLLYCDLIYKITKVPVTEELAYALVFQEQGTLELAQFFVFHYCRRPKNAKYFLANVLGIFVNNDYEEFIELLGKLKLDKEFIDSLEMDLETLPYFVVFIDEYCGYKISDEPYSAGEDVYLRHIKEDKKRYNMYLYKTMKFLKKGSG
jgi:hypothetical protein